MKETADLYRLRSERGEWAHIFLTEGRRDDSDNYWGTVSIVSSYGTYGFIWSYMSKPLREFLKEIHFDYAMGKFKGCDKISVFDQDSSIEALKQYVIENRRYGSFKKKEAREMFDGIKKIDEENDCRWDVFCQHMEEYLSPYFYQYDLYDVALVKVPDPQCLGFWNTFWPMLLNEFEQEKQCENRTDISAELLRDGHQAGEQV